MTSLCLRNSNFTTQQYIYDFEMSLWTAPNFVNCDFFFTKLSGIDCRKSYNSMIGGLTWLNLFMVCGKLVAMTIYKLKGLVGMM